MPFRWNAREHLLLGRHLLRWLVITGPVAVAIGSACALFLWSLDLATVTRWTHPWLLYLLPVAGVAIAWLYGTFGGRAERGNNLLMDEIHERGVTALQYRPYMTPEGRAPAERVAMAED